MTHSFPTRRSSDLSSGRLQPGRYRAITSPPEAAAAVFRKPRRDSDASAASANDDSNTWRLFSCDRSEEHTSELQSLMRISYAVFCLKKNKVRLSYNKYYKI